MLTLEQIDHAIEMRVTKKLIEKGMYPDKYAFLNAGDEAGFRAALEALGDNAVIPFGPGGYQSRGQLRHNNIIINRLGDGTGQIGYSFPIKFVPFDDNGQQKFYKQKTAKGTSNVLYEVRFVCETVAFDRDLTMVMLEAFSRRKYLYGVNPDMTLSSEGFEIFRSGTPVDVSGPEYLERVYRYVVRDVVLEQSETIQVVSRIEQINVDFQSGGEDLSGAEVPSE